MAKRGHDVKRMGQVLSRHRGCGPLLDLDDVRGRLSLREQVDRGFRAVAVSAVIGTGGRCCDFDRCFHPLKRALRERTRAVKQRFGDGAFPPIEAVQVGSAYFVVDGHHRVAAARELGVEAVDAHVVALATEYGLTPESSEEDVGLAAAERAFREGSGLAAARPGVRVRVGSEAGYRELLVALKSHGYDLSLASEAYVAPEAVAAHWLDCVYAPLVASARAYGLVERLPLAEGDLVLSLLRAQQASFGDAFDCRALAEHAQATVASTTEP